MKDSYYALNDGICVVNFAQMEGDAICYTDLIKVGVALDNGEIVSIDARGYLMNHKDRTIPTPKVTKGQAQQRLSPKLTVLPLGLLLSPQMRAARSIAMSFAVKGRKRMKFSFISMLKQEMRRIFSSFSTQMAAC